MRDKMKWALGIIVFLALIVMLYYAVVDILGWRLTLACFICGGLVGLYGVTYENYL